MITQTVNADGSTTTTGEVDGQNVNITTAVGILPPYSIKTTGESAATLPPTRCTARMIRGARASRTPGKTKGGLCTTDAIKKFFACSPKAYKHSDYDRWQHIFKVANKST